MISFAGALIFTEKRGYLYKVGGNVKSWNMRYFILQPGIFRYFRNDPVSCYSTVISVFIGSNDNDNSIIMMIRGIVHNDDDDNDNNII